MISSSLESPSEPFNITRGEYVGNGSPFSILFGSLAVARASRSRPEWHSLSCRVGLAHQSEWQRDPETRIDNRRSTWRTRRRAHPGLLDPHRSQDGNVDEFIKLPHRVSSEVTALNVGSAPKRCKSADSVQIA